MSFLGIEIARRSLHGHQRALTTTSHNIANISTDGYSRQEAVLQSTLAISYPAVGSPRPGQLGTGVTVSEIMRYRDAYLDRQVREAKSTIGYHAGIEDALQRVEAVLPEPSDFGIQALLGNFFNAWHTLAQDVDNAGSQAAARGAAQSLAGSLTLAYHSISGIAGDMGNMGALDALFAEINYIGAQIEAGVENEEGLLGRLEEIPGVEVKNGDEDDPKTVTVCGVELLKWGTDEWELSRLDYDTVLDKIRSAGVADQPEMLKQLAALEKYVGIGRESGNLFNQHMTKINSLGRQIAELNWEIAYQKNAGANPNDLLDRRDFLLEELGKLADVHVSVESLELGTINVSVYGEQLVVGAEYENRETGFGFRDFWKDYSKGVENPTARPLGDILGQLKGSKYGELAGVAHAETKAREYLEKIQIMMAGLVNEINETLGSEEDPADFFAVEIRDGQFVGISVGEGAAEAIENITAEKAWELAQIREKAIVPGTGEITVEVINDDIEGDDKKIKIVIRGKAEGDGDTEHGVKYTLDNYYHHLTTGIGADINTAQRGMENVKAILGQIEGLRESVSGVNLDEELTMMMQYLYGYQAAGRVVTMMDELLDTLINRMAI